MTNSIDPTDVNRDSGGDQDRNEPVVGVAIGEVDPDGKRPAVFRAWQHVSAEHIEVIVALLGEPDETSIYGADAQSIALDAYVRSVSL